MDASTAGPPPSPRESYSMFSRTCNFANFDSGPKCYDVTPEAVLRKAVIVCEQRLSFSGRQASVRQLCSAHFSNPAYSLPLVQVPHLTVSAVVPTAELVRNSARSAPLYVLLWMRTTAAAFLFHHAATLLDYGSAVPSSCPSLASQTHHWYVHHIMSYLICVCKKLVRK